MSSINSSFQVPGSATANALSEPGLLVSPALGSWGVFERDERAALAAEAVSRLPLARLDLFIANVKIPWAARQFVGKPSWERTHYLVRQSLKTGRELGRCPMSAVSMSWFSDHGRYHLRGELRRRAAALIGLAEQTGERPKLVTLTFADTGRSWSKCRRVNAATGEVVYSGWVRAFLNRLKVYFRSRGHTGAISYFWISELQEKTGRYAVHLHVVLVGCPYLEKGLLRGWWIDENGLSLGWVDVRAVEAKEGLYYAMKYINKATIEGPEAVGAVALAIGASACGLRRHGSSRDVSGRALVIPEWVVGIAAELELELSSLDWCVDGAVGYLTGPGVETIVDLSRWGADSVWSIVAEFGRLDL